MGKAWNHTREPQDLLGEGQTINILALQWVAEFLPETLDTGESPIYCVAAQRCSCQVSSQRQERGNEGARAWPQTPQPSVKSRRTVMYKCYRMWTLLEFESCELRLVSADTSFAELQLSTQEAFNICSSDIHFLFPLGFCTCRFFCLEHFSTFSPYIPPRYVYLLGTQLRSRLQRKLSLTTPRGLDTPLLGSVALSTILSQHLPPGLWPPVSWTQCDFPESKDHTLCV